MVTRIRQLLEEKQLTPTQFADLIGVGRPVVSHILSERNKPSLEVVQRVVEAFPEIALPWLLRGTGPMLAEAAAVPTPPAAPMPEADEPAALANAVATAAPTPPAQAPPATPTPALEAQPNSQVVAAPPKVIPPSRPPALPAVGVAAATPIAPKAFQAARFVPGAAKSSLAAAPVVSPKEPNEVLAPAATAAGSPQEVATPALPSPEPASMPTPATPITGPVVPTHLPLPVEPGKAIRRIVIFYRDGSFADYQPEA